MEIKAKGKEIMEIEKAVEILRKLKEEMQGEKQEAIERALNEIIDRRYEIKRIFDKNELKRLERAAKDKNKNKVIEWAESYEKAVDQEYYQKYEKGYHKVLSEAIDNFLIALSFTLHFNEKTRFGNDRLTDFMDDFMATINGFTTGEYSPEEYKQMLTEQKIYFRN